MQKVEKQEKIKIEKKPPLRALHVQRHLRDGKIGKRYTEMETQRHVHTETEREQGEDLKADSREMLSLDGTTLTATQVVHLTIPGSTVHVAHMQPGVV